MPLLDLPDVFTSSSLVARKHYFYFNFLSIGFSKLNWAPAQSALEDENVKAVAAKHGKTPAQILLRYVMDRGIAIIPKSVNPARIVENFNLFDFSLTPEEIKQLESNPYRQRLFLQDL